MTGKAHFAPALLGAVLMTAGAFAATTPPTRERATQQPATQGPAENGSPAWHLQPSSTDPSGHTVVDEAGNVTVHPPIPGEVGTNTNVNLPRCMRSTLCQRRGGPNRYTLQRVTWDQTLGYKAVYPVRLPPGDGGVASVGLDSKGNLWVFQRKPAGSAQLFQYDPNYRLLRQIGDDVIGHQSKPHCLAIDANDNVWICDVNAATVMKLSPEGKLLMTIGVKDHRGDWDEAKGQHLLWQPMAVTFGPNGDVYIGQGHGNESPNDVESDDPANVLGTARVLHLDSSGKFIGQWYGDETGEGKFDQVHGFATDPKTGDLWIGDREQYRIVVYSAGGKFVRTMVTRNLSSSLRFDADGTPWMATGQDGQVLKLDRNARVIGAIGNGMGTGNAQFIEAGQFVFDKRHDIYVADTSVGRVTKLVKPGK